MIHGLRGARIQSKYSAVNINNIAAKIRGREKKKKTNKQSKQTKTCVLMTHELRPLLWAHLGLPGFYQSEGRWWVWILRKMFKNR